MIALGVLRPFAPYLAGAAALVMLAVGVLAIRHGGEVAATQTIELRQSRQVQKATNDGNDAAAAAALDGAFGRLRRGQF